MSQQAETARWMRAHSHELAAFDVSEPSGVRVMSDLTRVGSEGEVQEFLDWFNPGEDWDLHTLGFWANGEDEGETDEDDWSFL